jgi:hypothetical protein
MDFNRNAAEAMVEERADDARHAPGDYATSELANGCIAASIIFVGVVALGYAAAAVIWACVWLITEIVGAL